MNSGKYLYSNSATKRVPNQKKINVSIIIIFIYNIQKPQLKIITNETINRFKKFILRLHKKEEEALLNKKKKREESKQKNKIEKAKINNNNNNMNNPNNYNYYPPNMYMTPIQINNQNPAFYNDYQNLYYINPQSYQINPQMLPPYFPHYMMPVNNLHDSLNNIYKRGIVNNIIAAFFIKECQDNTKNSEKRKVPVSTVELNDEQGNENNNTNDNNNINNEENFDNKNINNNYNNDNRGENEEKNENENENNNNEEKKDENEDNNNNNNHNDNELIKPSIV